MATRKERHFKQPPGSDFDWLQQPVPSAEVVFYGV